MNQYILVMLWMVIIYIISKTVNVYQEEYVCGKKEVRVTWGFAIFCVMPLIWWTATRTRWFGDTDFYINAYEALPSTFGEIPEHIKNVEKDKGFSVLSILIKMVIGNNATFYLGILASIHIGALVVVFRKYSSNYIMALFLFVAATDYISWMHNGIRQFIAVVLIFAATGLILKKKYVPLIAIIFLASTIHGSAILMLPIVFIVQGKAWNKKTMIAICAFVLAIVFVDKFTNLLGEVLVDTQNTNVVSDWQGGGDDGTNPIRVFIYSIPTLLSLIGYPFIKAEKNPVINLACNMAIISTMLYCLSAVTSGIFIGRLPIYCSMYATGILLPWEVENMFKQESTRIIKILMLGCFTGFYYYQMHFGWGLI